jgi:hypothetical protein
VIRRAGAEVNIALDTKPAQIIGTNLKIDILECLAGDIALSYLRDQVVVDLVR